MSWLVWIALGALTGIGAQLLIPEKKEKEGAWVGVVVQGILGGVLGGWIWALLDGLSGNGGMSTMNSIQPWSILWSLVGAGTIILLIRMLDYQTVTE
jgi:uncharacterized membrane protein YeaQ/YmgE (transglycosylase-associated protein family)